MALAFATREQFKIKSEVEVVHIPTGAVFQAYAYSKPEEYAKCQGVLGPKRPSDNGRLC